MADQYSSQYDKAYISKTDKLLPSELNGKVRYLKADITLGAEITTTESVFMGKIPANAIIKSSRFVSAAGTSGTMNLGWAAGESESADANGFNSALNASGAVDDSMDVGAKQAGYGKRFAEELDIILSASVITVGMSGKLVEIEIEYIVE